jgi:VWFA-related protein
MMWRIRSIFIVLLALSTTAAAQDAAQDSATPVFRTGVSVVRVDAGVSQDNVIIKDLTKEDFVITDQAKPQTITSFGRESEPLSLMLLLDISGSMHPYIREISETAQEAVRHLKPGDSIGIMAFGARTALHFHLFDNHAEVVRQLRTVLDRQGEVGYTTAINRAIIDTARYLDKNSDPTSQRAILILTDNLCINYQANDQLAIGAVLAANAVFNAIVVGRGIRPGPPKPGSNPDYTPADVYRVAEDTGGITIKAEDAGRAFDEMIARIRDRYMIGYNLPSGAITGEFRRITLDLTPEARRRYPNAIIRHRPGYYVR